MNGTSLTDIHYSIVVELKEEGIEPTLDNIIKRLGEYLDKDLEDIKGEEKMKTPEEIIRWCDMMLVRHPNTEDINFFNSIKDYMKQQRPRGEWTIIDDTVCECPRCRHQQTFLLSPKESNINFCEKCGAYLRSKEE